MTDVVNDADFVIPEMICGAPARAPSPRLTTGIATDPLPLNDTADAETAISPTRSGGNRTSTCPDAGRTSLNTCTIGSVSVTTSFGGTTIVARFTADESNPSVPAGVK